MHQNTSEMTSALSFTAHWGASLNGPSAFRAHIFPSCPWVPLKALAWWAAALGAGGAEHWPASSFGPWPNLQQRPDGCGWRTEAWVGVCWPCWGIDRCFVRTSPGRRIPGSAVMCVPSLDFGPVSQPKLAPWKETIHYVSGDSQRTSHSHRHSLIPILCKVTLAPLWPKGMANDIKVITNDNKSINVEW